MISKPMVPPWDDSAKNIARSQVARSTKYSYRVLTDGSSIPPAPGVVAESIYSGQGTYSPGIGQNLRVMLHGLRPRGADIYHYFFAPNSVTSFAGRVQKTVARVKTVQTVCSIPASFEKIGRFLFCDIIVVLSEDTKRRMIDAGVESSKLRLIRPCIEPIEIPKQEQKIQTRRAYNLPDSDPVIVFPGDYEFSSAAQTVARAVPLIAKDISNITVVFACRIKRAPSIAIRDEIKNELIAAGYGERVRFIESFPDMPAFVGAADAVIMPAESLYAKMDAPLVLLEAMAQKVPLVLANTPPLDEILSFGAGLGVSPGDPEGLADALKKLIMDPALRDNLGTSGARAVGDAFSADAMVRAIENVYDELLRR
ncbi:MAG: glycosyltransferase family 4 protein [Proteobacteria bacterium]|nr:glycosyltransferase family 4 protein [Pseudomonadota bacterium]